MVFWAGLKVCESKNAEVQHMKQVDSDQQRKKNKITNIKLILEDNINIKPKILGL